MKTLLSGVALLGLALSCFGQQVDGGKLAAAAVTLGVSQNAGPIPPSAVVAYGLIDKWGNVVTAGDGSKQGLALTAGTTVTFAPANGVNLYLDTPAQNQTVNATTSYAVKGQFYTFLITTSGTTSYTITFGTNFTSAGTLVTGTTTAIVYEVVFQYDGTTFREVDRCRQGVPVVTVPYVVTTSTLPYAEGVSVYNFTPTTTENLAVSAAGRAGASFTLHIIGDASAARTITFTTNVKPSGTLATGSSGATDSYATFVSDGTNWRVTSMQTGGTP